MDGGAWWAAVHGVAKSWTQLSDFTFTFHFHTLEKEMATHSRVLAWRIPGMGEPGGLPSMGSHRVGHDWSDLATAAATFYKKHLKKNTSAIPLSNMYCAVLNHSVMSNSLWSHGLYPTRLLCPWESPSKNTGVGSHAFLHEISPTQGSNPDLPHRRRILYHLSH